MSGCDPDTIVENHRKPHSLLCKHHAYFNEQTGKVVYLHDDEMHETCDHGHTHHAKVCPTHDFNKVAKPGEDCSQREDCHVHIREDGVAEVHHPKEGKKGRECEVVNTLRPLT